RSLALQGRQLFQRFGCINCHHPSAGNRAPALENLFGRRVPLEGGGTALADESYIRESILIPARKVRAGYRPIMPPCEGHVTEGGMVRMTSFTKGVRDARDSPPLIQQADPPEARDQGKGKDKDKGKKGK